MLRDEGAEVVGGGHWQPVADVREQLCTLGVEAGADERLRRIATRDTSSAIAAANA